MSRPDTRRDVDLQRIEAALAEGAATAADPRERELQELALALRAESPEPRAEFARTLERRVGDGFARPARDRRARLRRLWVPAFAAAAVLILVAVVALSSIGGDSRQVAKIPSGPVVTADRAAPSAPSPAPFTQSLASRRVQRNAQLTISTSGDKIQTAADGVGTVAESHNGFVLSSQVSTGDSGTTSGGSFVLRVPQTELQSTLADLSKLGHLRARSESGQDMTSSFNSVQDRLGNALVERSTLRLRLHHAKGSKADSIRARIIGLNAAVDTLNARMHDLRSRTAYSTVSLTLEQDKTGAGTGGPGGGGGTGAAWHDAVHSLDALLNFAIRALGVLLPLGLVAGLAGLGARTLRRRRREATLG
jgi:hypothetical protein